MSLFGNNTLAQAVANYDAAGWRFDHMWPKAGGHTYLFGALRRVGRALYGDGWTDEEPHAWFGQPFQTFGLLAPPKSADDRELLVGRGRFTEAVRWLAEAGREGLFMTAVLIGDGPMAMNAPLHRQPDFWNGRNDFRAFAHGTALYTVMPDGRQIMGDVFIETAGLDRALSALLEPSNILRMDEVAKLSPYLRFALALAEKGATDHPKESRKALVAQHWDAFFPGVEQSGRAIEAIARVVGMPDPKGMADGAKGPSVRAKRKSGDTP